MGKAFLDIITGSAITGSAASQADAPTSAASAEASQTPTALQAYSKAGRVVEKHGRPVLTAPAKEQALDPSGAFSGIPEPTMNDGSPETDKASPARPVPKGPSIKPMTDERAALIRRAVAIHRAKRGLLNDLSAEQRERLAQMALAAFRIKR